MDLFDGDVVDWDTEVDPFPFDQGAWMPGTNEGRELLDMLFDESETTTTTQSKRTFEEATEAEEEDAEKSVQKKKQTKEAKEERKARLAETCRRFRDRRKEEVKALKSRNEELEAQRGAYLREIADLQLQTQMSRNNELVDLAKENKLLRVEIRKHKRFIQTLLSAVQNIPLVTPEEKYRLLLNGMSSAHGQALGLVFTSSVDKTWSRCDPFKLHNFDVFFKHQYLPLGSTSEDAKRVSIRIDVPCVRENLSDLANKIWAWVSKTSTWEAMAEASMAVQSTSQDHQLKSFHVEEIFPEVHLGASFTLDKEDIRVYRCQEAFEGQLPRDMVLSSSIQDCEISRSAFPGDMVRSDGTNVREDLMQAGQLESKTIFFAASPEPIVSSIDGVERVPGPLIDASFLVPLKDGSCHLCIVQSFPIFDQKSLVGGMSSHHGPIVLENGEVSPFCLQTLSVFLRELKSEDDC